MMDELADRMLGIEYERELMVDPGKKEHSRKDRGS
jgi:hypothetical protein